MLCRIRDDQHIKASRYIGPAMMNLSLYRCEIVCGMMNDKIKKIYKIVVKTLNTKKPRIENKV